MITATGLELRAGPRLLLGDATFRIAPGDRVGLVGRNGAGKTTLTRVLAGEGTSGRRRGDALGPRRLPPAGPPHRRPPRARARPHPVRPRPRRRAGADALDRGRDGQRGPRDPRPRDAPVRPPGGRVPDRGRLRGRERGSGHLLEPGPARARARPAPRDPLRGQRRRVELARILFSSGGEAAGDATLLLDEPTNHLDADSIGWLRDYLRAYKGGLVVISHDAGLLEHTVTRVFHLDANRAEIDLYNVGWRAYLVQRETDERRRKRERANAEKQAGALKAQADRMRYKATKAKAAQNMDKRAQRLLAGLDEVRRHDRVAKLRFPDPSPCGKTPLTAEGLSKSYGSLEVFTDVDLAIDRGSRVVILGLNGAGKTTLMRLLAGIEEPDTGEVVPGHGLKIGYYAQEHETLDPDRTVLENMRSAAPDTPEVELRRILGSFLFSGDDVDKPARVLSGGEKTRLALATLVVSSANVLMLDEPTNNLDPASREEILGALRTYKGAVVLVTHDEGAVDALQPERLILLPDGVEDLWNADYADLVALA